MWQSKKKTNLKALKVVFKSYEKINLLIILQHLKKNMRKDEKKYLKETQILKYVEEFPKFFPCMNPILKEYLMDSMPYTTITKRKT